MSAPATVFVGLGGNVGDRAEHLRAAVTALDALHDTTVVAVSGIYRTRPVGPSTRPFFNACVRLETTLEPLTMLEACLEIERSRGRVRGERWAARTLDVDLLTWLDGETPRVLEHPRLTLPHPHAAQRDFVLVPLADVADERPVLDHRPVHELLPQLPQPTRTVLGRVDAALR